MGSLFVLRSELCKVVRFVLANIYLHFSLDLCFDMYFNHSAG